MALKRLLKIIRNIFLTLLGLIVLVAVLINLTPVQNFLARKAASYLSNKLHTKVSIGHVRIDLLSHVVLQDLYIEDQAHDTLLYAGSAEARITDWFFLKKEKPVLHYVALRNTYAHLYRKATSNQWNYQFAIDAFASKGPKDTTKSDGPDFDIKQAELENVRIHMDDAWAGSDMDFDVGSLALEANDLNIKGKSLDISRLAIGNANVLMHDYKGGRPTLPKATGPEVIDTIAFNPSHWKLKLTQLSLNNCGFKLQSAEGTPAANEFDPEHMQVTGILLDADKLTVMGDTLTGNINNLSAHERCGFELSHMSGIVKVSPNESVIDQLKITTPHSTLQRYYAMHYTRFPDFLDYINKVRMVADLNDASIDARDVAYFAPALKGLDKVIRASGKIDGTVARITGKGLDITDGSSTVRGDLVMNGLPDIDRTFIDYQHGEILTSGKYIMGYVPSLRNNPSIDLSQLQYAYFNGDFTGYLSSFAANGVLKTNLGTIQSDVKLKLGSNATEHAIYNGIISTNGFTAGGLFRQPWLGTVAFKTDVAGVGFDPETAQVKLDAVISHAQLNGYNYHNISTDGVLSRRKFDGKLLVDDSNLAAAFYGTLDFSGPQPIINATANVLKSDLQQLKLINEPVQATADFDLNLTGSNIDNVLGYARLYNINLLRNGHRLDVDSININSSLLGIDSGKLLTVEANDVSAHIKGHYELSKLAPSTQYFLSRYLPNYVQAPKAYAPDQDITFDVTTRQIDSLLLVLMPRVKGFDNTTVSGSLNTSTQQFTLAGNVPYGKINGLTLTNVALSGTGNFNAITLKADIARMQLDSILNVTLSATTSIGSDSISFNVATTSTETYGTAHINGNAYARGDSLYFALQPSNFFLNNHEWDIPAGGYGIYSTNYLLLHNILLQSGDQQIAINSEAETTDQMVKAEITNLDLGILATSNSLADYRPGGRLSGTVDVTHLFNGMVVEAALKGNNVLLGTDTLGDITLSGSYKAATQTVTLNEGSGIFRGDAALDASGSLSFDSTSHQPLEGQVTLHNAPLQWIEPALAGLMSNLTGTMNGRVMLGGSAALPDIAGSVKLTNAGMQVDYTGVKYAVSDGTISFNNRSIDFGALTLTDRFKNTAKVTGNITHNRFKSIRFALNVGADRIEAINLNDNANNTFYGNLIANAQFSISGPIDDLRMNIKVTPVAASHLYLPISNASGSDSYSFISFKKAVEDTVVVKPKATSKLAVHVDAIANPLAEVTLILDAATGDQITAKGNGSLSMDVPASGDIKLYGNYNIDEGSYNFTFKQLFINKLFIINSGSRISFSGAVDQTTLNVQARYATRASLYDLLSNAEKQGRLIDSSELVETKRLQEVNVLLSMTGKMLQPDLSFKVDLPERRSIGTYAYTKLQRLNQSDRDLFDQVASLLLIGNFIPPEGIESNTATTGVLSNLGDALSATASRQLTNVISRLLNDPKFAVDLKYKNYNLDAATNTSPVNRNEVRVGLRDNFFSDRLILEVGSVVDWGRPNGSNANSNFNPVGDFQAQYLLSPAGNVRLSLFNTSSYDALLDQSVRRSGVGISWRKSFDSFAEFIHGKKFRDDLAKKQQQIQQNQIKTDSTTIRQSGGTE